MHRVIRPSLLRRWLLSLAMLAFVGTQWLGLAHGVLHGTSGAPASALEATTSEGSSWLADLGFGHDKGSPLCQLFDLAASVDGVLGTTPALLLADAQFLHPEGILPAGHDEIASALYSARAPPQRG